MKKNGRPKATRNTKTVALTITPEAWERFKVQAKELKTSRSELVERFIRGELNLNHPMIHQYTTKQHEN